MSELPEDEEARSEEMKFRISAICSILRRDNCMRCIDHNRDDDSPVPSCLHAAIGLYLIADQGHPYMEDCHCGHDHTDDIREWRECARRTQNIPNH